MGTIGRLLLLDITKTLSVVLTVLILLFFSNAVVKFLGRAARGVLDADIVMTIVGLELLKSLGPIVPPALFFSILWVLGRMYRDSEMVALSAAGYSTGRVYRAVLLAAAPLALLVTVLVMEVLPWSKGYIAQLKESRSESASITGIRPGRFNEFERGGLVVYTERLSPDGERLEGVFVQDRQHGKLGLVTADYAYQTVDTDTGERFVVLKNGHRYETGSGGLDFAVGSFDEYAPRIPEFEVGGWSPPRSAKPWEELIGSDNPRDRAEFQNRLSVPLAVFAFAILAVPLSRTPPRSGIYGRLIVAVLLYFVFLNLQRIAERMLEDEIVPAWLGMWWLPLSMVLVAGLVTALDSNRFWVTLRRWRAG